MWLLSTCFRLSNYLFSYFHYQFLYLYSFGKKEPIRKRKYDIVNIDEVDNMLIEQMSSPAIIGNKFNFYQFKKF